MRSVLLALLIASFSSYVYAEPRSKLKPEIEAQAPPKRSNKYTPEEICDHLNREDGSWWRCMIKEYRDKPCDIACQLSIHDR